ncbi:MAG: restriction endonuclease [Gaiellaceae bacterium]
MPIRFELTPSDYENGVADLLAQKFEGRGTVERNVRLPSRSGGRDRQIDVLVRLPLAGMGEGEASMIVDCKRYGTKVDMKDVEAFIGMVEDVGAAIGLLVTTEGFTDGAIARAKSARAIHIEVIRVEELPGWEPPLIDCELCRDALREDEMPGMLWLDRTAMLGTEDGEGVETTLGYCDRCGGLHVECPGCGEINAIGEWRPGEWTDCEAGCGLVEFHVSPIMIKDDLTTPTHGRLTLRLSKPPEPQSHA